MEYHLKNYYIWLFGFLLLISGGIGGLSLWLLYEFYVQGERLLLVGLAIASTIVLMYLIYIMIRELKKYGQKFSISEKSVILKSRNGLVSELKFDDIVDIKERFYNKRIDLYDESGIKFQIDYQVENFKHFLNEFYNRYSNNLKASEDKNTVFKSRKSMIYTNLIMTIISLGMGSFFIMYEQKVLGIILLIGSLFILGEMFTKVVVDDEKITIKKVFSQKVILLSEIEKIELTISRHQQQNTPVILIDFGGKKPVFLGQFEDGIFVVFHTLNHFFRTRFQK